MFVLTMLQICCNLQQTAASRIIIKFSNFAAMRCTAYLLLNETSLNV